MKKILTLFLSALLLLSLLCAAQAEIRTNKNWHADASVLMDASKIPQSYSIDFGTPEGEILSSHTAIVEKISSGNLTMCVSFALVSERNVTDWSKADAWLSDKVTESIKGVAVNTETMARTIAAAVELSDHGDWSMTKISVMIPYYPELTVGSKGAAAQKLQSTLIRYGFLTGAADGQFGEQTRVGVKAFETYMRDLEQDVIETMFGTTTPETPAPSAPVRESSTDALLPVDETAAPSSAAHTPETVVDGVADATMQAYLYCDEIVLARKGLALGDRGIDVTRLQTRLTSLGYFCDTIDGIYGNSVSYAVKLFQYYNNLEITGNADKEMLLLLYSDKAKASSVEPMTEGTRGDRVAELQKRLKLLGFTSDVPDSIYGTSTVATVKVLQQYMIDKGLKATSSKGGSVTVEVNGIADCLLLEAFYSDSFPYASATLQNGSSGLDVTRMQLRLKELKYLESDTAVDGAYGNASASAVKNFQGRHGLTQTGIADSSTLKLLFSEDAQEALKPYKIRVSTADQRVYVYTYDTNGEYTVLVKTFVCSTGRDSTPTPKGTFRGGTGPGARWHYFTKFNCWAQYAYYIEGDIMFHSVLYNEKDGPVTQSSVRHLGSKASHGCVRLAVEDAKWIWNNCPAKTTVVVE